MNELDQVWAQKLNEAHVKAQVSGNAAVAEYLNLRANNDLIRRTSIDWLFESLLEIAAENIRGGLNITIEVDDQHRFQFGNANLAGSLARLRQGVRCLTLEAGWTRTPADGFMRGGALAVAKITHFGLSKFNAELLLIQSNDAPNWFAVDEDGKRDLFNANNLQKHFQVFAG